MANLLNLIFDLIIQFGNIGILDIAFGVRYFLFGFREFHSRHSTQEILQFRIHLLIEERGIQEKKFSIGRIYQIDFDILHHLDEIRKTIGTGTQNRNRCIHIRFRYTNLMGRRSTHPILDRKDKCLLIRGELRTIEILHQKFDVFLTKEFYLTSSPIGEEDSIPMTKVIDEIVIGFDHSLQLSGENEIHFRIRKFLCESIFQYLQTIFFDIAISYFTDIPCIGGISNIAGITQTHSGIFDQRE